MKKDKVGAYKEFCTGCGMCAAAKSLRVEEDRKGFPYPAIDRDDIAFCEQVCPAAGTMLKAHTGAVWGEYKTVYLGWAKDDGIRFTSASGGGYYSPLHISSGIQFG